MAALTMAERKALPKSAFAIPEKAPGDGSYPIHDRKHAELALQLSGGKPEESRVRAAVMRRYPEMAKKGKEGSAEEERTESKAEANKEGDDDKPMTNSQKINRMLRRKAGMR